MRLILLSGGSGKRLWPLSNDSRSKQFIKVLVNEQGQYESMIQRVWRQMKETGLQQYSCIATSKLQREVVLNQLEDSVEIIVEPERRDTFPAIALAVLYLYSNKNIDLDEVITVLPVDPFVENHFFESLKQLESVLDETNADLALIGVKPTYPSEKYGYIIPDETISNDYFRVSYFKEKPTEEIARELLEENAFWNCGVFAFRLRYIISILEEKGLPLDYDSFFKNYYYIPKNSFDFEVVENTKNIVVIPYNGYWKDIGTWNTFTDRLSENVIGKGVIKDCGLHHNNHIINELDIPVALLGLSDIVVAASPDGILVSSKDSSANVKEIANEFENRPMFEERRWGWYRVLDYIEYENGNRVLTRRIHLSAGKNLSYQYHTQRNETWLILSGLGELVVGNIVKKVNVNELINIPVKEKHAIRALTDLEFIEIQSGKCLSEEDVVREFLDWNEIINFTSELGD